MQCMSARLLRSRLKPEKVAIIGGGVTGLSAAFELEKISDCEIHLFEATDQVGGKLQTRFRDGFTIEWGPDCYFTGKPGMEETIRELDLESEVIEPKTKQFALSINMKLHRVSAGTSNFRSPNPEAIEACPFLSQKAKKRILEATCPNISDNGHESIRSFFTRRFGSEYCRKVVEPLLAGTHGGLPDQLSMNALYPDVMKSDGSREATPGEGSKKGVQQASFNSFRNGMATLITAFTDKLCKTTVQVESDIINLPGAEFDKILLAVPANRACIILNQTAPRVAAILAKIPHVTSTVITMSVPHPVMYDYFGLSGFLIPPQDVIDFNFPISGATFSSEKWDDRAPEELALIRLFLSPVCPQERHNLDLSIKKALEFTCKLLKFGCLPRLECVDRWEDALPQYNLGHLRLLDELDEALMEHPNIFLAGTSYRGVGIPDCVRQGREVARKMVPSL